MTRATGIRRGALLAAAALIGAGGLAGQTILVSCSGLALGFARASAVGLTMFVAAYAVGAWLSGRARAVPGNRHARRLAWAALLSLGVTWVGVRSVLATSSDGGSATVAAAVALAALGALGLVQGGLLPALLRVDPALAGSRAVALIFAANLAGSLAGARFIAFDCVAAFGRSQGALAAGLAAALGALLAGAAARTAAPGSAGGGGDGREAVPGAVPSGRLSETRAALLVGLGTAWVLSLEWIALRHALLWLESQEVVLHAVLSASLAALALGALTSGLLPRGALGVLTLVPGLLFGTWWIAHGAPLARAWSGSSAILFAMILVGPALACFGAWLPALYRASEGEVGRRMGRLAIHEAWGALLGAPLVQAWLVPSFGLAGALAGLASVGALLALLAAPTGRLGRAAAGLLGAAALALAVLLARGEEPALRSPLYTDPALAVRSFAEDSQFAVGVVDDGLIGERTLLTDRFRAAGTGRDYLYMRALGHLPLLLHPAPRRVAVMCLGTGTTLGAAFLHPEVERLEVLEISPAVVAAAPWFESVNQGALAPEATAAQGRVRVRLGDGRRSLADSPGSFDVVTMEPLLPDSPFGVYLYTREFYAVAKRSLAPGGIFCQWVPPHALEPAVFDAVCESFSHSFAWSGRFLFGTQLVLIGAEHAPELLAGRFPEPLSTLGRALAAVNLDAPGRLRVAFVGDAPWPAPERPLSDDDPWIVFEEKRADARVFLWLQRNLERLRQVGGSAPEAWTRVLGSEAGEFARASELLLQGRIGAAAAEAAARQGVSQAGLWPAPAEEARLLAASNEVGELGRSLLEEQRFLARLRLGVGLLPADPRAAADQLLDAALLRRERADVHLYVSAALHRLGDERGARAAKARALELCPRVLETPAGLRAAALGLP
ncbi:MAG: hypothetical protein IPK67_11660 [Planctomycetes bacterium]|nr:hypothetical protein [Planctomycetota bacterium]